MPIKIKLEERDGQMRVNADTMDLLIRLGEHKDLCEQCANAIATGRGICCPTGHDLLLELGKRPDVSQL